MSSLTYWQRRQQQLNKQLEKDEAKLKKRLSSFYDAEFKRLEKQIAAYYTEYGENNVIQYRKLMESLSDADKRLLNEQMDAFAKKYPQYADLMPVRASIYKLNRLEGLQYSVRMQQLQIGAVGIEELTKHLERNGLRAANAAAEAMGFGKNFYAYNQDILKKFVGVSWSNGKNFSESIWQNTDKLAAYLNADMAHAFARGDAYQKIIRDLKSRFDKVSRNDMYRLIYTEGTYVMAEATMTPFEGDFERYRISTVGDGKVCPICRGISGQIFEIKDRKPGENFPPFHPWCRCTFEIVVDDWDAWLEGYERKHGGGQAVRIKDHLIPGEGFDTIDSWKRIDGEHPAADDVLRTNPHYREGQEYRKNCQRCVVAYEMRRRGYDVIAKPATLPLRTDSVARVWPHYFKDVELIRYPSGNGLKQIKNQMQEWGDKARAHVYIAKNKKGGGIDAHVFVAEQRGWITEFYDPQSGKIGVESTFDEVIPGKTMLCRIDNCDIGNIDLLKECVEMDND